MNETILDFIERRFKVDCGWKTYNSYWFAKLLTIRFQCLSLYFNDNEKIFIALNRGNHNYYDYDGVHDIEDEEGLVEMDNLIYKDPTCYLKLMNEYRD